MGLNKWQEIVTEDMHPVEELRSLEGGNWWSIGLKFGEVFSALLHMSLTVCKPRQRIVQTPEDIKSIVRLPQFTKSTSLLANFSGYT